MLLLEIKNTTSRLTGLDRAQHKLLSDTISYEIEGSAFAMRSLPKGAWDGRKRLLQRDGSFPAGLTLDVAKWIKEHKLEVQVKDLRNKAEITKIQVKMREGLEPRPFQAEAVTIATSGNKPRGIFVIGTGGGKSITAAMLIDAIKTPTLFVTPDKGLKVQTLEVFRYWLGKGVSDKIKGDAPIVVVNVHQIAKCEAKDLERFRMLMIDEFHHCFQGDTVITGSPKSGGRPRTIKTIHDLFHRGFKPHVASWGGADWVPKRVVNAFKRTSPELLKVTVEDEHGVTREVLVTRKHKFFTPKGKIEIGSMGVGDEVFIGIEKQTLAQHLNKLNKSKQHRKAVASGNKARSKEVREGQAEKIKSLMKAGKYVPYGRGKYGNGGELTSTQKRILSDVGGEAEFTVAPKDSERPYHYKIDVAFPKSKIAIEIDGSSHKNRQAADQRKNLRLGNIGWKIIRVPENCSKDSLSTLKKLVEMMSMI